MIVEREDNSALYFIVGGLLVAVMAFAFFYFQGSTNTVPESMVERSTVAGTAPAAGEAEIESNSTTLSVGDDTISRTTTTTTRESTQ
mgnify:CR=1 FL=1